MATNVLILIVVLMPMMTMQSSEKTDVEAPLNAKVILPCSFHFIKNPERLTVVWAKMDKDGTEMIVHKFRNGKDLLTHQHIQYKGRTELSMEYSQGKANLTLRNVNFNDEGTYYCRAANGIGHGDKEVELSISEKTNVGAHLYANVVLPCSFPFKEKRETLTVVWVKDKNGTDMIAHRFRDGEDVLTDQHIQYTSRTELSMEFSQGKADLILRDVTFNDEGTYYCRTDNGIDHGDKEVELTISDLNADTAAVTLVHIDGKKRLKCIDVGVFRNPWVKWYDMQGKDVSEYGTRNITDLGDGKKMVESVLDLDVETNKHYICQVKEGRLKRSARAVPSDGKPVIVSDINLQE